MNITDKDYKKSKRIKSKTTFGSMINYFDTHHPCRKCKGYVPDGAIVCIHCQETNP